MTDKPKSSEPAAPGERIAKVLARAGLCSRRDAERWIEEGRVAVNGRKLKSPAFNVGPQDRVVVDGQPLPERERTRLWLYHKPRGLVTTARDPEGRPTVFSRMPSDMPRVIAVGRLDINTEGLLLLTNDGGLARVLELPATGWLRRYRVRAHGEVTQAALDALKEGVAIDGVLYGGVEASLDKVQGSNVWLTLGLREGQTREGKRILAYLGLDTARLIRISYGPFQLVDLVEGEVREIRGRILRDQLGAKLARAANADFDAPVREVAPKKAPKPAAPPEKEQPKRGPRFRKDEKDVPRGGRELFTRRPDEKAKPVGAHGSRPGSRPSSPARRDETDGARAGRAPFAQRADERGRTAGERTSRGAPPENRQDRRNDDGTPSAGRQRFSGRPREENDAAGQRPAYSKSRFRKDDGAAPRGAGKGPARRPDGAKPEGARSHREGQGSAPGKPGGGRPAPRGGSRKPGGVKPEGGGRAGRRR